MTHSDKKSKGNSEIAHSCLKLIISVWVSNVVSISVDSGSGGLTISPVARSSSVVFLCVLRSLFPLPCAFLATRSPSILFVICPNHVILPPIPRHFLPYSDPPFLVQNHTISHIVLSWNSKTKHSIATES